MSDETRIAYITFHRRKAMKDCRLISLWMIPALLLMFSGCSRTPCYKGYVPATEKEALAFGQELVDRAARGDDSWYIQPKGYWHSPKVRDANEAVLFFYGLDIPTRNPSTETEEIGAKSEFQKKQEALREEYDRRFKDPVLKGVKPMYGTYTIYFDFTFDKTTDNPAQAQFLSEIEPTQEKRFTIVKNKKTGEIVIAGEGMSLPKPKGKQRDYSKGGPDK